MSFYFNHLSNFPSTNLFHFSQSTTCSLLSSPLFNKLRFFSHLFPYSLNQLPHFFFSLLLLSFIHKWPNSSLFPLSQSATYSLSPFQLTEFFYAFPPSFNQMYKMSKLQIDWKLRFEEEISDPPSVFFVFFLVLCKFDIKTVKSPYCQQLPCRKDFGDHPNWALETQPLEDTSAFMPSGPELFKKWLGLYLKSKELSECLSEHFEEAGRNDFISGVIERRSWNILWSRRYRIVVESLE